MTSGQVVLPESLEREEDWFAFREAIVAALEPAGAVEQDLAEHVAATSWRRRRVARFESELAGNRVTRKEASYLLDSLDPFVGDTPPAVLPDHLTLIALARYEAHLDRQYYRALHELQAQQARRRGEAPPMARVEVHGLPGG